MKDSIGYKVFKVINAIVLILIVIATVYPFWNVVVQSFSSENAITAGNVVLTPVGFNLETYKYVMNDPIFWINYKNTIIYTVVGTAISLFLTTTLAYVTSKKYLPGRRFFIGLSVFTMFFAGGLIPNYLLIKSLGWMNTMWAVTVPGALSIFNMLIMKSFFESMPDALEEAAIIDGATPFQILMRIILPLSKPILATMVLFYAVGAWNAWFGAFLYMDNKNLFPVSVYLRNLVKGATGAEAQSADEQSQVSSNIKAVTMVLTVLPVLVVYPFCQKYFVNGIMIGSVKG